MLSPTLSVKLIALSEIPGHVLDWAGGVRFSIPGWHGAVSASLHGYRKR